MHFDRRALLRGSPVPCAWGVGIGYAKISDGFQKLFPLHVHGQGLEIHGLLLAFQAWAMALLHQQQQMNERLDALSGSYAEIVERLKVMDSPAVTAVLLAEMRPTLRWKLCWIENVVSNMRL